MNSTTSFLIDRVHCLQNSLTSHKIGSETIESPITYKAVDNKALLVKVKQLRDQIQRAIDHNEQWALFDASNLVHQLVRELS
jgi:hypothetical protein